MSSVDSWPAHHLVRCGPTQDLERGMSNYTSSDTYNGTHTDKYSWSQTITDIDVKVPVDSNIKKGKDVTVDYSQNQLRVTTASGTVLVDGKFTNPIIKGDSYWNLSPGEAIHIWLQKAQEKWWSALIEGETPIDMKSIEAVRPMEELAEDEQAKLQELMFNQEQKQKGLPTSDEIKMHDILKKAWDVEGSPFKGTPFDPSKVNVQTQPPEAPS